MEVYPDYLEEFSCIASKCHHSCCVGWEIDIDEKSLSRFLAEKGQLGEKLRNNIREDEDGAGFILDEEERCPFLMDNGLCELICEKGSGYLCDICADHPRFRNFFTGVTELGLGLCCEEAARLILSRKKKVELKNKHLFSSLPEDEKQIVVLRGKMLEAAQNRTLSSLQAEKEILELSGSSIPNPSVLYWVDVIKSLEKLSDERDELLELLGKSEKLFMPESHSVLVEQLMAYFLFRHIPDCVYYDDLKQRVSFCMLATEIIYTAFSASDGKPESFYRLARVFSSEVEYSEENLQIFMEKSVQ